MKADLVVKNGWLVTADETTKGGVAIKDEKFVVIGEDHLLPDGEREIDAEGRHILPGIIDGHVHFREPGLGYKEDFTTGSTAAVCGGVTMIMDMPNVAPPTTGSERVREKARIAEGRFLCDYGFFGAITQTNADQILPMKRAGVIGYKIFLGETTGNVSCPDDGVCVEAFARIAESGLPVGVHAENREIMAYFTNKLKAEGKNDPIYWEASRPALCEAESVHRALFFAEAFGVKLHVYHLSSKQAAWLVRDARTRGIKVTAETTPHHLLRDPREMAELGPLLKINPPVRGRDHMDALWEELLRGNLDMVATDHSPHTFEEKGLDAAGKMTKTAIWDCASGFCGVETGAPLLLTEVNKGRLTLNHYVKIACENPAKVWQIYPQKGALRVGSDGDLTIVDMDKEWAIDGRKLHSKNKPTPWHGWKIKGAPIYTIVRGHIQMRNGEPVGKPIGRWIKPEPSI
jgi:dihydroorotase (multifunctional complex type)